MFNKQLIEKKIKENGFADVELTENRGSGIPKIIRVKELVREKSKAAIYTLKCDNNLNVNIMGHQFNQLIVMN